MTRRAWAAVGVLGVLVVVMIVVAVRVLPSHHHSSSASTPSQPSTQDSQAAPPPPASDSPSADQSSGSDTGSGNGGDGTVLSGDDITAAHRVMVSYLQSLGSYSSSDRQPSWRKAALAFTDGSSPIKSFTHLPTGKAWATCQQTHCTSQSTARVLHDTATTNVAGSGGGPQVVSYVDLTTRLTAKGTQPSTQHTQFTITATQVGDAWKVSGCTFAGVGDTGANGDGP